MSRAAAGSEVQWQSADPSDLTKREKAKIRTHWQEFVAFTAPPGVPFEWCEWRIEPRLKHYALHHGFIVESDGGWETASKLWMFLVEHASPDEEIGGRAVGQEQLPVDVRDTESESRVMSAESPGRSRGSGEQQTLGGDELVNTETHDLVERNAAKGESEPSRAAQARADDAQASLTGSSIQHGDWDGPTPSRSCSLSRASRDVRAYARQEPLVIVPEITGLSG